MLGLDDYGNAGEQLCDLLERCYDKKDFDGCLGRLDTYFDQAPLEAQADWLDKFTTFSCLESCGSGRFCLNIPPLCAPTGSCEQPRECCGFLDGKASCVKSTCCATRGAACATSKDCCAGAGQCSSEVCGGIACIEKDKACTKDGECCTKICKKSPGAAPTDQGACAATICQDDKGDCTADADCCNLHCDTLTSLCAPLPMCGKIDAACSIDPDCCPGTHCLIASGNLTGMCSAATCSDALVDCSADDQCCSGHCDPIAFFCMPACLGTGTTCANEGQCCTGQCENGVCAGTCSTGFCNQKSDCCGDSDCIAHACTAACNPVAVHDPCTAGGPIAPTVDNQACLVAVCGQDPYCCCGAWDDVCVAAAVVDQANCLALCH